MVSSSTRHAHATPSPAPAATTKPAAHADRKAAVRGVAGLEAQEAALAPGGAGAGLDAWIGTAAGWFGLGGGAAASGAKGRQGRPSEAASSARSGGEDAKAALDAEHAGLAAEAKGKAAAKGASGSAIQVAYDKLFGELAAPARAKHDELASQDRASASAGDRRFYKKDGSLLSVKDIQTILFKARWTGQCDAFANALHRAAGLGREQPMAATHHRLHEDAAESAARWSTEHAGKTLAELGKLGLPPGTKVHVRVDWRHPDVGNDYDHWFTVSGPDRFIDSLKGEQSGKAGDDNMRAWVHNKAYHFEQASRSHLHVPEFAEGPALKTPKAETMPKVSETSIGRPAKAADAAKVSGPAKPGAAEAGGAAKPG